MNRGLVLTVVLITTLGTAAYGQGLRAFESPNFTNPRALAGAVNSDGSIARGSHFTARHVRTGEYRITFDKGYFLNVCPVVTVTDVGNTLNPPTNEVHQPGCGRTYYVYFWDPGASTRRDYPFFFVAVGT